jgi:hypothetical protein
MSTGGTHELLERGLNALADLVPADEDGRLGVLDDLGLALFESPLDTRGLGLAAGVIA